MDIWNYAAGAAYVWLLFMLRTLGFVALVPLISGRSTPVQFRIMLVFFMTMAAFSAWSPQVAAPEVPGIGEFVTAGIGELILGMMLGFIVSLIFVTFQFAGQFIGYQMGFAIVNVLDPQSQSQVSLIGQFLFVIAMLAFLNLNLHHEMIYLWHQSFDLAPPGSFDFAGLNVDLLIQVGDDVFFMALKIAIALLSFLMLTDLSLGIIARVMPQMNVFIVGIPLKIALGMFFLSLLVLQLDPVMHDLMKRFIDDAGLLLRQIMAS